MLFRSNYEIELNIDCKALNTKKSDNGKCECEEGFKFGDPNNVKGCYNCLNECHIYATCNYPGKCKCIYGYNGNGIDFCEPPIPSLKSIIPDTFYTNQNSYLIANFVYDSNLKIFNIYCKFNNFIILGNIIDNDKVKCYIPKLIPQSYDFYISFNNKTWSNELQEIIIIKSEINYFKYILIIISIFLLILAFNLIKFQNINEINNEEIEPFKQNLE